MRIDEQSMGQKVVLDGVPETSAEQSFSPDERLYTPREVAIHLGVSERWVRDHASRRSPRIRAVKLGPLLRFRWTEIQRLIAELALQDIFPKP